MLTTSPPFCMFPSEELLHSEHLGPSELEAPAPGGSNEDKGGLQPLDSKDGELTQIYIIPDFGVQAPNLNSNPLKSGGVLATTVSGRGWEGMSEVVEASVGSSILLPRPLGGGFPTLSLVMLSSLHCSTCLASSGCQQTPPWPFQKVSISQSSPQPPNPSESLSPEWKRARTRGTPGLLGWSLVPLLTPSSGGGSTILDSQE